MTAAGDGERESSELRLAVLAARVVQTSGLGPTRQVLEEAARRAATTRRRITALAGRGGIAADERDRSPGHGRAGRVPPGEYPPDRLARPPDGQYALTPAGEAGVNRKPETPRPTDEAERRARALAARLARATGERDWAPWSVPLTPTEAVVAEATELALLLAAAGDCRGDAGSGEALAIGRDLLALALPDGPWRGPAGDPAPPAASEGRGHYPLVVLLYALGIVVYLLLRYRGHYVEQDTAEMTQLIEAAAGYGSAIVGPGVHPAYPSGFGFQAVNLYLLRLSGASVQTLQSLAWPFLLPGLALLAFLAFREMTGDDRAAALGGLFLFMQPDFLFTALRGSHEKMTYCLLLAALLLLFRSYRYRERLLVFAAHVALFYLMMFAILATNSTFGSSLIVAFTFSFFGGVAFSRLLGRETGAGKRALTRLAYVSFSSFLLLFMELFYFYQPSEGIFRQFQSALDRIAGFALSFEASDNPYAYVALGWRSTGVYLMLTAFTWLTLAISGLAWLRLTARFLRGGWLAAPVHLRLRWLLYAGLALQVGFGIAVDFAGVLGANLQLRLFPVYMFVAIPTSSAAVVALLDRARSRWPAPVVLRGAVALGTAVFTALSAFKATNEPLLSNKWTFYSPGEAQAMDWLETAVPDGAVWADVDERVREVDLFRSPPSAYVAFRYPTLLLPEEVPVVMLSHITRERMARLDVALPDTSQMNEIYDNGLVQIYRQLPKTPLQR